MSFNQLQDYYIWLSPDTMFYIRDPDLYRTSYAEDWRTLVRKYGAEQLNVIYDWLYMRIYKLSFGQFIVIEKDAASLTANLWLKGRFAQWNVSDDERVRQFKWIAFLMIEWIWQNNPLVRWVMERQDDRTLLRIAEPDSAYHRDAYSCFGHWPLSKPSIRKLFHHIKY